jgi:uncharacterized protein (DUF302 family)
LSPRRAAVITTECPGRVDDVVRRAVHEIERRGIEVFALIDHSGEARDAGLELRDTKLVLFGDPTVGTPLMQAHPLVALELPLKLLVTALDDEGVLLAYSAPHHLAERYGLTDTEVEPLRGVESIVRAVTSSR